MTYNVFASPDAAALARRLWYWPFVRGVLTLLFGLLAIFLPDKTPGLLVQVFGIFVMVDGLVSVVDGLRRRGTQAGSANLGIGIVALVFGAILLFLPQLALGVVLVLVAVWALAFGLLQLFVVPALRRRGGATWVWSLITGLLLVALAVVCFTNPGGTIAAMSVIIGAFAVAIGIALIVLGLRMRKFGSGARGPRPGEVIEGRVVDDTE